jgi:activator of HSP90 ATPase
MFNVSRLSAISSADLYKKYLGRISMSGVFLSRRALIIRLGAIPAGLSVMAMRSAAADDMANSAPMKTEGLTRTSAAIHQEVVFTASRQRVYAALTDAKRFDAVTRLSDAITLMTAPGAKPTAISRDVGGSFVLFGGYVTGRHVELVKNERLVQVWRAASWKAGDYSIARFALVDQDSGSKLVFDHEGFPAGEGEHLAAGWYTHYWQPLGKYLAQSDH